MTLWKREFGPEYAVPTEVTDILTDVSWHNDACPRFILGTRQLWVEHPDPAQRESGFSRYAVFVVGDLLASALYEGESLVEALHVVKGGCRVGMEI